MHTLESNANIPTFILKLWKLVCDESSNDLICWNRNGRSFIIKDQGRFAKEMLPLYFKHNNMASFIRQLNMYGFRKVSNIEHSGLKSDGDEVEFFHHYFSLGQEDQLQFIKRKMSNNKCLTSIVKVDEIQDILADVESIKGRQDSVDTLLNNLKQENEALWREVAMLRQKHIKQQQIVEKLLQFLVSIVRNRVVGGIKRKAPLLIDSNMSNNRKIIKNKDGNAICIASSPSTSSGPIIHDITDLEDPPHLMSDSPSTPSSLINGLQLNLEPEHNDNENKSLQTSEDVTSLIPTTNVVDVNSKTLSSLKDSITLPEILEIELNQNNQNNSIERDQQQQDFNTENSSTLQTPKICFDESVVSGAELKLSQQPQISNHTYSTDLVLPAKQKSTSSTNLPKLTSENFNDHVEGIDTELNWLHDQLYGGSLNIDPSTLLGYVTDGLDTESTTELTNPKAIMDGGVSHNKLIKIEDNSNSSLFDALDLNNIGNDTKGFSKDSLVDEILTKELNPIESLDILSDFTADIDSSTFN